MAICPVTLKPCCDDLCLTECFRCPGESALQRCPGGCGQYVPLFGRSDVFECECEPEYYDYDEQE